MAQLVDFWKIVTPNSKKNNPNDTYVQNGYSNYSFYTQILAGATERTMKYKQIDIMDNDVLISRALDTIAEEMTPVSAKTNLPLEITYNNEDNVEVDEITVATLRAALRFWTKKQKLNSTLFQICRYMIKYGDCFFRKNPSTSNWVFIHPRDVIGIEIDDNEVITRYHVRNGTATIGYNQDVLVVNAPAMVHFSLSDIVDHLGPFGESILTPVIKAYRQLALLEDAVIIYRIVRAPERRVFFIDTGNMPPQRQKQYLEGIKNDMRQKRIPNKDGGQESIDGIFNPTSMLEDYFFATSSSGKSSRVETLPGGESLGEITDVNYFQEKVLTGLRVPTSYMRSQAQGGAQTNDGKVGIAYIEELRFSNFVARLQQKVSYEIDFQFKEYLKQTDINIDPNLFAVSLLEPQNFALYKQSQLDADLVGTFSQVEQIDYISKRFALKRYFGWTEEDVQMNELMLKQERAIADEGLDEDVLPALRMLYDPKWKESRPAIVPPEGTDTIVAPEAPAPAEGGEPEPSEDAESEAPEPSEAEGDEQELPDLEADEEAVEDAPEKEAKEPAPKKEKPAPAPEPELPNI